MQVISHRRVDEEQAREWINRQTEFYTHNQSQAYRLIQLVIAAGTLLIAFLTGSASSLQSLLQPNSAGLISNGLPGEVELLMINSGAVLGFFFLLIAVIYIFDSVQWAFEVLRTDKPKPGLGGTIARKKVQIEVGDHEPQQLRENQTMRQSQLSDWLNENRELLQEMNTYLSHAYKHLATGGGFLILSMIFLFAWKAEVLGSIAVMVVLITVLAAKNMKNSLSATFSLIRNSFRNSSDCGIVDILRKVITEIGSSGNMNGNFIFYVLLLIFTSYLYSTLMTFVFVMWFLMPESEYPTDVLILIL